MRMFVKDMIKLDGLLLLVAIIWGFAFVAQRSGMEVIGPFAFSGVRFALGAVSLLPVLMIQRRREARSGFIRLSPVRRIMWAVTAGTALFIAVSLQQVGLVKTTAGNAGFITCLYVVLVPMVGIFLGRVTGLRIWIGTFLALIGLYILSIGAGFKLAPGDSLNSSAHSFGRRTYWLSGRSAAVWMPSSFRWGSSPPVLS